MFHKKQAAERGDQEFLINAEATAKPNRVLGFMRAHAKKLAAAAIVIAAAAALAVPRLTAEPAAADTGYTLEPVRRRDITSVYSGSGTIEAAAAYTVKPLVSGTVLTADFEVGDTVQKGDVLCTIDSSEAQAEAEKAQLTLNSALRAEAAAEDAGTVRADISGTVSRFLVRQGDTVAAGQAVAVIRDASSMLLTLSFPAAEAEGFAIGQSAQATVNGTFETVAASVLSVSGTETSGDGSLLTRAVTLSVPNTGSLTPADSADASVNGVSSLGSAHFAYSREQTVTAPSGGKIAALCVSEGAAVSAGDTLATLTGGELDRQLEAAADEVSAARLSLDTAQKRVADCVITSPISGTVVQKNVKAGDTVNLSDSDSLSLCTVYDMSSLEMTLSVDELKILSLAEGQKVSVTADALPDETCTGTITSVLYAGTTAAGVTTYPVTVRLAETGRLRPGMNASAEIITASAQNALSIPNAALLRGRYVLVTDSSPSAARAASDMTAPEGFAYVKVTTGVSDDDYIEITSGLTEADTVAYDPSLVSAAGAED